MSKDKTRRVKRTPAKKAGSDGTFPDIPSTTHASGTVKAKALKLQDWSITLKPKA